MANLREARVLVESEGVLWSAFKLGFSRRDASIYVIPYAKNGRFFFGAYSAPEPGGSYTIKFREQLAAETNPTLSIHETGQVHIYAAGTPRAGPVDIGPLSAWTGEHLASIHPDTFDCLPRFTGRVRTTGAEIEVVIASDPGVTSGVFALYLNGARSWFPRPTSFVVSIARPTLPRRLYLAGCVRAEWPLHGEEGRGQGVTVLAGWDPRFTWGREASTGQYDLLFLRGE